MSQNNNAIAAPVMGGREWAMLLALAVLWGGSFFFNAVAVRELPSFTLVWLRVAVAAATLLLVLRLLGQRMPTNGRVWTAFFGMGLLNKGTMRKCVVFTPRSPDHQWQDCRWPALDTTARTRAGGCRRGLGFGFAAAGGRPGGSTAFAGAWRSAC